MVSWLDLVGLFLNNFLHFAATIKALSFLANKKLKFQHKHHKRLNVLVFNSVELIKCSFRNVSKDLEYLHTRSAYTWSLECLNLINYDKLDKKQLI